MTPTANTSQAGEGRRWTLTQDALFCDALADGKCIREAAFATGKSKGAGISKLRKIVRALGDQAR